MIKKIVVAALCLAQVPAAQPAVAAELIREGSREAQQRGAFAGMRLRVPLGTSRERPHMGLALTMVQRSRETPAMVHFAEGAELGFSGDDKVRLSFGGKPVSQLAAGRSGPTGQKLGFSTAGWIAIGASVVIIVGGVLIFDYIGDQSE